MPTLRDTTALAGVRAALYLRVSTDEQTTENQRLELEAVAARRGWRVVAVFEDAGISGAKGRDRRPGFDALIRGATSRKFDVVLAWAVDRLGRSLRDLVAFLGDLQASGVDLYLHQQSLDTSTPSGRAMFAMCGIFAEFEREMIRARVHAGLARARKAGKSLGRPKVGDAVEREVHRLRATGLGIGRIARQIGVGTGTVQRILA